MNKVVEYNISKDIVKLGNEIIEKRKRIRDDKISFLNN